MIIDEIKRPILSEFSSYQKLFDSTLDHENNLLGSALSHIRQRKGKMMRPILVLLMAKEMGTVSEATYHSAVTLELLHTASLVHDDIVDDSNERRGQASVNAVYDNKVAVLIGDYLLSTALEQAALTNNLQIVQIISKLGKSLSEGEILQLSNIQQLDIDESTYFRVISQKTAALFEACTLLGALSVNADDKCVELARSFGEIVGICFQIRDDIFDYYDNRDIGKPTGNDMLEGKLTLPAIYALNHYGNEEMMNIAFKVKKNEASPAEIASLVKFTKSHGGIEYATEVMARYRVQAQKILDTFKKNDVVRALTSYLDFVMNRSM